MGSAQTRTQCCKEAGPLGLGPGWAGRFLRAPTPVCSRQVLPHEREVAGALMTFFLALGLSCGASLSFLFKALL